ncbi:hypothetical protein J7643_19100 [bacterium]|nr:hypothetical protein [bacterium]
MSLELLKNALCQAIASAIPTLVIYPDRIGASDETFPNLSLIGLETFHLDVPRHGEIIRIPNPDPALGAAPYLVRPVIARKRSKLRLQLRDRLAEGEALEALHGRLRECHNALDRFFSVTRSIRIGPESGQTLAELWYESDQEEYDAASSLFLHTYQLRLDPWRLLEAGSGTPTYRADHIAVGVSRERDGALLINRVHPPHQ